MPAAAVKREGQALFIFTGRKGCVGCFLFSHVKIVKLDLKLKLECFRRYKYSECRGEIRRYLRGLSKAKAYIYITLTLRHYSMGIEQD